MFQIVTRLNRMENWVTLDRSDAVAMVKLKDATQCAQTLGELYALMEDYSYQEFMQIYKHMTPEQQAKLNAIEQRDSNRQLVALETVKSLS